MAFVILSLRRPRSALHLLAWSKMAVQISGGPASSSYELQSARPFSRCLLSNGRSGSKAPVRLPLTSHWAELRHMLTPEPILGKGGTCFAPSNHGRAMADAKPKVAFSAAVPRVPPGGACAGFNPESGTPQAPGPQNTRLCPASTGPVNAGGISSPSLFSPLPNATISR